MVDFFFGLFVGSLIFSFLSISKINELEEKIYGTSKYIFENLNNTSENEKEKLEKILKILNKGDNE